MATACTPGDRDAVTVYSQHRDFCRLLSDAFHDYAVHYSTDASADGSPLMTTASYLVTEEAEAVKCQEMFEVVRKYETLHTNTWQVGPELAACMSAHAQLRRLSAAAAQTVSQASPTSCKYRQSHRQSSRTLESQDTDALASPGVRCCRQRHSRTLRATSSWFRRCCMPAAASASATR